MNKKILIALVIVSIVIIVATVVGIFLLGGPNPPVDISGINPPTTMTTEELLPAELAGVQLDEGNVYTYDEQLPTGSYVKSTMAKYDGIWIFIVRANNTSDASLALDLTYENMFGSGSGTRTKTADWFQCDIDGLHAFVWRSGVWVFGVQSGEYGVQAGDSDTMKQAAEELVEHLRSLS